MTVTLHDATFAASGPLQLTCAEGLSLIGDTLSADGILLPTDADSDGHRSRVTLCAFATLADACDSTLHFPVGNAADLCIVEKSSIVIITIIIITHFFLTGRDEF